MAAPNLIRRIGSDATAFIILGIETAYRGAVMSPAVPINPYRHPLLSELPEQYWSWIWIGIGAATLAVAVKPRSRVALLAWSLVMALHVAFGVSLLMDSLTAADDYPALASVSYLTIPALACWGISRRQEVTPPK